MRLRIDAASGVFYPDVLVHGPRVGHPTSTLELTEARLVAEVLSSSWVVGKGQTWVAG